MNITYSIGDKVDCVNLGFGTITAFESLNGKQVAVVSNGVQTERNYVSDLLPAEYVPFESRALAECRKHKRLARKIGRAGLEKMLQNMWAYKSKGDTADVLMGQVELRMREEFLVLECLDKRHRRTFVNGIAKLPADITEDMREFIDWEGDWMRIEERYREILPVDVVAAIALAALPDTLPHEVHELLETLVDYVGTCDICGESWPYGEAEAADQPVIAVDSRVSYRHGKGRVVAFDRQVIAGKETELLVIRLDKGGDTVRVPVRDITLLS